MVEFFELLRAGRGDRVIRCREPRASTDGGVADTLDEAKVAFRAAWERPLSEKEADEICST
jgi:hypothetical protein